MELGKVDSSLENRDVTAGVKDSGIQCHATSELPAFEEYLKYWNVENLIQYNIKCEISGYVFILHGINFGNTYAYFKRREVNTSIC